MLVSNNSNLVFDNGINNWKDYLGKFLKNVSEKHEYKKIESYYTNLIIWWFNEQKHENITRFILLTYIKQVFLKNKVFYPWEQFL